MPKFQLVVVRGESRGKGFALEEGENLIGRWDPESNAFPEIDLEDDDPEAKVSRKHAIVEIRGARLTVRDVGSLNGTFLNRGARLAPGEEREVKVGDELIFGKTFMRVEEGTLTEHSGPPETEKVSG